MNLRYISLTGADNLVEIKDLEAFSEEYPLFECAMLIFAERDGLARNPNIEWRKKLYNSNVKNKAMHVCGSSINQLAQEKIEFMKEMNNFQRVQINLKPQWATEELINSLVKVVEKNPQIEFITQHNELNKQYFHYWEEVANHSYLYDGSLGKGLSPEIWLSPVIGKRTGYAGGLNVDNIYVNCQKIQLASAEIPIWIDMETGIRTNDQFDLIKAKKVLEIVTNYK